MNLQKDNSVETLKIVQKVLTLLGYIAFLLFLYFTATANNDNYSTCYRYENSQKHTILTASNKLKIEGVQIEDGNYVIYTDALGKISLPVEGTRVITTRC